MNCAKSHGESTTNKVVFHPIKSVMDDTIANPATFPEWGEMLPFCGVCCVAHSLFVSSRSI
jgi:hypothetical protein